MTDTLRVGRQELSSAEVFEELQRGNRVEIRSSLLGKRLRLVIREQGGKYYCDTPVRLFTFEEADGLIECLERYRLVRPGTSDEVGSDASAEAD